MIYLLLWWSCFLLKSPLLDCSEWDRVNLVRLCPHDITIIVVALLTSEFVSCSQGLKILAMSRLCPFNHGTRGRGQSSKIPQNRNPIYQLEKIISVLHQNELDIKNLILPCIPQKLGYINILIMFWLWCLVLNDNNGKPALILLTSKAFGVFSLIK